VTVLAYLFWHRPREPDSQLAYEQAQLAFHRSLAHNRPVGMCGSASFRVAEIPWLAGESEQVSGSAASVGGYEDWYLVEDYTALGVLGEAAVGHGHRGAHDQAARGFGVGAGGLYGLIEGQRNDVLAAATLAIWVARPPGSERRPLGELLGDGMDPQHASLWRRQLVFGPAPEFCLLAGESSAGVAPTRLPQGWSATTLEREVLFRG
jgi:hypothetical protein